MTPSTAQTSPATAPPAAPARVKDTLIRGEVPPLFPVTDPADVPDADVNILVVPCVAGPTGLALAPGLPLDEATATALWKTLVETGATGDEGRTVTVPAPDGVRAREILAVGLGGTDATGDRRVREAAGLASRVLRDRPSDGLTVLSLLGRLSPTAAVEGHALGAYRYTGLRTTAPRGGGITRLGVLVDGDLAAFVHACTVVEAVTTARDLVNSPADLRSPERHALVYADLAERSGLGTEILDGDALTDQGFGGLTGVSGGSDRLPRLLRILYRPDATRDAASRLPHVALVGGGLTTGTAGTAGAAAVVAAVTAAAELELPVAVTATVPLVAETEGPGSLHPGAVLRHYGGTTTEVSDTGTAGTLILADAVARAAQDRPDLLVAVSALTGSRSTTFGDRVTAVTGTPAPRDRTVDLADTVGEDAWPAPLPVGTAQHIRSDVADLCSSSRSPWTGTAAAGHYLAAFVPDGLPWVHLDCSGPSFNTAAPHGEIPERATGSSVRTLVALLEDLRDYPRG